MRLAGEHRQKVLSTAIITAISFIGFEVLSYILSATYQLGIYVHSALYIYLFHVFWLTFLFDLHFRKRGVMAYLSADHKGWTLLRKGFAERVAHVFDWHYFRHYLNFLVLPGILYWSVILLMSINPFNEVLKQLIIATCTVCLAVAYWYLKEIFNKQFELHHYGIKLLGMVKLFAAFLAYAALIGTTFYFGYGPGFLFLFTFVITFLLIYQALFQHRLLTREIIIVIICIAGVIGLVSLWIFNVWNHVYLVAAVILLAVYNTGWGILHHYLDKNLTKKLAYEYLLLLFLVVSILLASHDFTPRIQ